MHSIYWSFDNTVCRLLKKGGRFNCSWLCWCQRSKDADESMTAYKLFWCHAQNWRAKFQNSIYLSQSLTKVTTTWNYRNTEIQPLTIHNQTSSYDRLLLSLYLDRVYRFLFLTIIVIHCTLYIAMKLNYETCITGGIGESKVILAPYRKWREVW